LAILSILFIAVRRWFVLRALRVEGVVHSQRERKARTSARISGVSVCPQS
jgi:hypothetical protein